VKHHDPVLGEEVDILQGPPILLEVEQPPLPTEGLLGDRREYIGGSDAAAICGLSPWKTAYQLYQEKRGEVPPPDLSANERVYWGTVLEEVVAREYSKRTGRAVRRVNRTLVHPDYPFIRAHIDRLVVGDDRILECKTTDAARAADWGEEGSEEIPRHYQAQPQHYLAVTGKAVCDVAVLIGGNRMRIYTIRRDEEFIAMLLEAEREFWERVRAGNPPDPATPEEAAARWRIAAPGELEGLAEDYSAALQMASLATMAAEMKEQAEALELQLMQRLGDGADTLLFRGQKLCTWKTSKPRILDQKALAVAHPDIVEAFRKEVPKRTFRLSLKS
jgi:putative phage-type endonuclease